MTDAAFDADRDERNLPFDEIRKIYDVVFDHDHYARIEGDGTQQDSYIDSMWEHAEQLVLSGRTAADILAAQEAAEYHDDNDEQLHEDTNLHSGLGY